jgi:DNA-nicking Smr family endonuclease
MSTPKSAKSDFRNNPFEALRGLLKKKGEKRTSRPAPQAIVQPEETADEQEGPAEAKKLFLEAVEGVKPMPGDRSVQKVPAAPAVLQVADDEDEETLLKLRQLVASGQGFIVADTPEYIEGIGPNVSPELARRLHRGDFSIQAYIDLHGFTVAEAREVFQGFLTESVKRGKRSLLVIHGRGLSSAEEPVIKNRIVQWLNSSQWRKWVIAYASARSCDGGAGATYILLRPHPIAKGRHRKRPARE